MFLLYLLLLMIVISCKDSSNNRAFEGTAGNDSL